MPQYQAGQTGTETLRAGSVLTVTLVAGTGATVARSIGGAALIREPALAATTSYGPYENDQTFQVCPFAGSTVDMAVAASPGAQLTDAQAAAAVALVSAAGNLAYAAVASTTGTPGEVRKLSDGPDKGVPLVWAIPEGASAYAWCWQIYPLAAYL